MALDTQLPPWLSKDYNAQPQSPWILQALQQGMERQKQNAMLPLQIQEAQLKLKSDQLGVEHQGLVNDMANMDMEAYKRDLPRIKAFADATGGDPVKMFEMPAPVLESVEGQKQLDASLKTASLNAAMQRHQQLETAKFALAAKAWEHGQDVPMIKDPITGQPSFSPQAIEEAFNQGALRDIVGKAFLEQVKTPPSEEKVLLLNNAKTDLAAAQASKDPARIAAAQQRLQSVMETMPGQQMTVFDPATGKPIVQMGKAGAGTGDLTTAATTEEQKQVLNTEQTVGDLIRTREALNSNNVAGVWPTLKNQIFDKLMGNIAPDFVDKERVAGRSAINWSKQDVLNQMRQRYGEHAVERISQMLPSTGIMESPEDARILADAAVKTLALESAKRSVAIGRQPAEHVLRAIGRLSNDELDKEMASGYLPPTVGIAAAKTRKLPPGQSEPVTGLNPSKGVPLTIAPGGSAEPNKITWEQLFKLYKSGGLRKIGESPAGDTEEE